MSVQFCLDQEFCENSIYCPHICKNKVSAQDQILCSAKICNECQKYPVGTSLPQDKFQFKELANSISSLIDFSQLFSLSDLECQPGRCTLYEQDCMTPYSGSYLVDYLSKYQKIYVSLYNLFYTITVCAICFNNKDLFPVQKLFTVQVDSICSSTNSAFNWPTFPEIQNVLSLDSVLLQPGQDYKPSFTMPAVNTGNAECPISEAIAFETQNDPNSNVVLLTPSGMLQSNVWAFEVPANAYNLGSIYNFYLRLFTRKGTGIEYEWSKALTLQVHKITKLQYQKSVLAQQVFYYPASTNGQFEVQYPLVELQLNGQVETPPVVKYQAWDDLQMVSQTAIASILSSLEASSGSSASFALNPAIFSKSLPTLEYEFYLGLTLDGFQNLVDKGCPSESSTCKIKVVNCFQDSELLAGPMMKTNYEYHVSGKLVYTIADYTNKAPGCAISHFDIVSDQSDLDLFQFCPSAVITTANRTARLDFKDPNCMKFELSTLKKYTYGFSIYMRIHGEYPETNTGVEVSITVKCMEQSAAIDIRSVQGMQPGPPANYLVDSNSQLTFDLVSYDAASECPVLGYYTTPQNKEPNLASSGLEKKKLNCSTLRCEMPIDTSQPGVSKFYIYAHAVGGGYFYSNLIVLNITCGSEQVNIANKSWYLLPTQAKAEGAYTVPNLFSYFKSSKPDKCDIIKFELIEVFKEVSLSLSTVDGHADASLILFTDQPFKQEIKVKALTISGKHAIVSFVGVVCGFEELTARIDQASLTFVQNHSVPSVNSFSQGYQISDSLFQIPYTTLENYFKYEPGVLGSPNCKPKALVVSSGKDCSGSIQEVQSVLFDEIGGLRINVLEAHDTINLCFRQTSLGLVTATMKIRLTICGFERVRLSPKSKKVQAVYEVFQNQEGSVKQMLLPHSSYSGNFTDSSDSCPIVSYRLLERDADSNLVPYSGKVLQILNTNNSLLLDLSSPLAITDFFFQAVSLGDQKAMFQYQLRIFDCLNVERVHLARTVPTLQDGMPVKLMKTKDFYQLQFEVFVNQFKSLTIDLKDRIISTDPVNCPIVMFHLAGYLGDLPVDTKLSDFVSLDEKGTLTFLKLDTATKLIELQITAVNNRGLVSNIDDILVSIKINRLPNSAPQMVDKISEIPIEYNDNPEFRRTFQLPQIKDRDNDIISIKIPELEKLPNPKAYFMRYQPDSNQLVFTSMKPENIGVHYFTLVVADAQASRVYEFKVVIKPTKIPVELPKFIKTTNSKNHEKRKIWMSAERTTYEGKLKVTFSEPFLSLTEMARNVSFDLGALNQIKDRVLSLEYRPVLDFDFVQSQAFPKLLGFDFINFDSLGFELQLDFENKLYVSSQTETDLIDLIVLLPDLFVGAETGDQLQDGYEVRDIEVSQLFLSEQEQIKLETQAAIAGQSLTISFVLPFCFMLFKSIGMDSIWILFNFLQLFTVIIDFNMLTLPSNARFNLQILQNVSQFRLTQHELILNMKSALLQKYGDVVLAYFDELTIAIFTFSSIVSIGYVMMKLIKHELVQKFIHAAKKRVIFSSILRPLIQYYLMQTLVGLRKVRMVVDEGQSITFSDTLVLIKLALLILMPVGVWWLLQRKNIDQLQETEFQTKFGSLYNDLRIKSKTVNPLYYTPIFCFRRLLLALTIVLTPNQLSLQLCLHLVSSICMLSYLTLCQPKEKQSLNYLEQANELFLQLGWYFCLLFTDFQPDLLLKYEIGSQFINLTLAILVINLSQIARQIIRILVKMRQKFIFNKSMKRYLERKEHIVLKVQAMVEKYHLKKRDRLLKEIKRINGIKQKKHKAMIQIKNPVIVQEQLTARQKDEIRTNIEQAFKDLTLGQMEQKSQTVDAKAKRIMKRRLRLGQNKLQVIKEEEKEQFVSPGDDAHTPRLKDEDLEVNQQKYAQKLTQLALKEMKPTKHKLKKSKRSKSQKSAKSSKKSKGLSPKLKVTRVADLDSSITSSLASKYNETILQTKYNQSAQLKQIQRELKLSLQKSTLMSPRESNIPKLLNKEFGIQRSFSQDRFKHPVKSTEEPRSNKPVLTRRKGLSPEVKAIQMQMKLIRPPSDGSSHSSQNLPVAAKFALKLKQNKTSLPKLKSGSKKSSAFKSSKSSRLSRKSRRQKKSTMFGHLDFLGF